MKKNFYFNFDKFILAKVVKIKKNIYLIYIYINIIFYIQLLFYFIVIIAFIINFIKSLIISNTRFVIYNRAFSFLEIL